MIPKQKIMMTKIGKTTLLRVNPARSIAPKLMYSGTALVYAGQIGPIIMSVGIAAATGIHMV